MTWDLRYGAFGAGGGGGPMAPPGKYSVSAAKVVDDEITPLGEPQEFEVISIGEPTIEPADPAEILALQRSTAN